MYTVYEMKVKCCSVFCATVYLINVMTYAATRVYHHNIICALTTTA